jgi:hypothetical protein
MTVASFSPVLCVVYDLADPDGLARARYHRSCWGILFTDVDLLFGDRVALTFRPSLRPGGAWREWERTRLAWILADLDQDLDEAKSA